MEPRATEANAIASGNDHASRLRYPLLPLQQGILFHSEGAMQTGCYVNQVIIDWPGALSFQCLTAAVQTAVDRHPVLRGAVDRSAPAWVIVPHVTVPVQWVDAVHGRSKVAFSHWLDAERARGFEVSVPPLLRFYCLKVSQSRYRLILSYHHLLLGGVSTVQLLKEVLSIYDAVFEQRPLNLPTVSSYGDCVSALVERAVAQRAAAQCYWRGLLAGYRQPWRLPPWETGTAPGSPMCQRHMRLPASLCRALERWAEQSGTTLNTVLQMGWALLLAHVGNTESVVFGVTRELPRGLTGSALGLWVNTLPVRLTCGRETVLREWITALRHQHRGQARYGVTSLSTIQSVSEVPPGEALFSTVFDYKRVDPNALMASLYPPFSPRRGDFRFNTHYPLLVEAYACEGGIETRWHFDPSVFDVGCIKQLKRHYTQLLRGIPGDLDRRVRAIPLLTKRECDRLRSWSATASSDPLDETVDGLFSAQASRTPNRVAVSEGSDCVTYEELARASDAVCVSLSRRGVQPGDAVAVCMDRSLSVVVGVLGILKCGGHYVPVSPSDPAERIRGLVKDSGAGADGPGAIRATRHDTTSDALGSG